MTYVLKNKFYEITFSSVGAEMISIKSADGRELLWQCNENSVWKDHAPLLFPFCGRLKDKIYYYKDKSYPMTIHGFARSCEFELSEKSDTDIVFILKSNESTREIYPFDFAITAAYTLSEDEITFKATVENTGNEELIYSFGWHPGFNLPTDRGQDITDYSVKFKDKKELIRVKSYQDYTIPSDLIPYTVENSEYRFCESELYDTVVLREAGHEVRLTADGYPFTLDMSWSENLPLLCIWKSGDHEEKFVCIEPWSHGAARGERSNELEYRPMYRLASGECETFKYSLKFGFDKEII